MTHSLSITDGTTTISLVTTNVLLTQYVPATPSINSTRRSSVGDGTPVDQPVYENVTETIEILFDNSSKTALQAQVNGINRLFTDAKQRQWTRAGSRVYLQLQVDGEASAYRSEIYTGRLELDQDALRHYANIKVLASITVERAYFWEGPEVELSISTSALGQATGGRTIYNNDGNAGQDNWVEIAATQVGGDLPTPAKVTLTNNTGSNIGYWHFHIGTNAYSDPANFTHFYEGESAASGGSTVSSGSSSGGNVRRVTFTGTTSMQWAISGSQLQKSKGRYFRVLVRFSDVTGSGYITPQIRDANGLTVLYSGDEVLVNSDIAIADLGAVPLPPSTANASWAGMRLYFAMRSSASCTFDIDFVQLTPTDSYAAITQLGDTVDNGDVITFDGIDGSMHADGVPIYTSTASTIWLYPNKLQRLIFLHDETSGTPTVANTFSVRVYARARRLTI